VFFKKKFIVLNKKFTNQYKKLIRTMNFLYENIIFRIPVSIGSEWVWRNIFRISTGFPLRIICRRRDRTGFIGFSLLIQARIIRSGWLWIMRSSQKVVFFFSLEKGP
jgi:hypothetical protein